MAPRVRRRVLRTTQRLKHRVPSETFSHPLLSRLRACHVDGVSGGRAEADFAKADLAWGHYHLPQERAQSQHISVVTPKQEFGARMKVWEEGIAKHDGMQQCLTSALIFSAGPSAFEGRPQLAGGVVITEDDPAVCELP